MAGKKILIVEDKKMLQTALARSFQSQARVRNLEIALFHAETVAEAEQILLANPDLAGVILDASLGPAQEIDADKLPRPDLTVMLFLKQLRAAIPSVKVVASSSEPRCNERLLREGCDDFGKKDEAPRILMRLLFPSS